MAAAHIKADPHRHYFRDLSKQEVLALAISSEKDNSRLDRSYAQRLRADYPDTAKASDDMAAEEDGHWTDREVIAPPASTRCGLPPYYPSRMPDQDEWPLR